MKPDQAKKIKKDPKQTNQWKLLLVEARLSRQLHYMKLNRKQPKQCGQFEERGKVPTRSDNNRTSPATNQVHQITAKKQPDGEGQATVDLNAADQTAGKQTIDQTTNEINPVQTNQTTAHLPPTDAQSNGTTLPRSINSRLNNATNATIDEVISEIRHQIIAHSQPFYEQQRRRQVERQENEIVCRICFLPTNERYRPCRCDGTMRYIHRHCLSDWIQTNRSRNCNICYAKYTGLTIIYHYPPASRWLLNDAFAAKQMICFLVLIAASFALYSWRALEFYASKIRAYREQANLKWLGNYFETLKDLSVRNLSGHSDANSSVNSHADSSFDKRRFGGGMRVNGSNLATTNISTSEFPSGLSNLTGDAVCRVSKVVNSTVANALSGVGKQIARQVSCNQVQGNLSHHHPFGHTDCSLQSTLASPFGQGNQFDQPASEPLDVYGHHHHLANGDQLDEQFAPWLNVFSWHLLVYLVFDLIQIAMYAVVCLLFVRYFVRQWLIWRYQNRSAEVVFEADLPNGSSQLNASQTD